MTKNREIAAILDLATIIDGPITVGNSTINVFANSTIIKLANSTVNTSLVVPSAAEYGGNYFLHANGTWSEVVAGATPGGANTQVQFNDSDALGGSAGFTFDKDTNNVIIANTLTVGTGVINSTNFSGTANNALYLGGTAAADYQTEAGLSDNVATLTANNANYLGGTAAASYALDSDLDAYQTEAGLSANVATLTANNAAYLGGVAAADYQTEAGLADNVATLTANNANYLGGTAAASYALDSDLDAYQTEAGLAANVATLTANNANYLGGTAAADYQTEAGLSANVATLTANNANYLGGTAAADYQTEAGLSANVATLTANNANYLGGIAAADHKIVSITAAFSGLGNVITTGIKGYIEVPFNCQIQRVTLMADQVGNLVVDIWKDTYANFPPTNDDSITSATPPTLSSNTRSQDSTLSSWINAVSAGDILAFNVDSVDLVEHATLSIKASRT